MAKSTFSQYSKELDFKPQKVWPESFPAMAWKEWLLTGFDRAHSSVIDLSLDIEDPDPGQAFIKAFAACYPQLTLAELSRLYHSWSGQASFISNSGLNWMDLFKSYGLRLNEPLEKTLKTLEGLPLSFQTWTSQKSLSLNDLAPLRVLNETSVLGPLFESFSALNPTKSLGTKIVELLVDLTQQGCSAQDLWVQGFETAEQWVIHLEKFRYPVIKSQDDKRHKKTGDLPWPQQTQAKWVRQGDEAGLEIRLFISSQADFKKKISSLNHISELLEKNPRRLWIDE